MSKPRDMDHDGDIDARDEALAAEADDLASDAGRVAKRIERDLERDADGIPEHLRWRPTVSLKAMLAGAFADVAVEFALHQLGYIFLDTRDLIEGIAQGSLLGAVVPMAGNLVGVIWVNQRIDKLRREVAA